jgi:DNA-binding GntR family transcriptional regulator
LFSSNHDVVSVEQLAGFLTPPSKRSLAEEVALRLRQAILNGQLAPGEPLPEQFLAESLDVSRGPVREALVQLEREGLVTRQRNRSAMVARLSEDDLEEVTSLRHALEFLAVRYACEKATAADLDAMQAVIDEMAACVAQGMSEQQAADLDIRFHDRLYQASHHERLLAVWSILRPQIYRFLLSRNVAAPDFADLLAGGHQQILDAIRERDPQRAIAVLEGHLRVGYERVMSGYG